MRRNGYKNLASVTEQSDCGAKDSPISYFLLCSLRMIINYHNLMKETNAIGKQQVAMIEERNNTDEKFLSDRKIGSHIFLMRSQIFSQFLAEKNF